MVHAEFLVTVRVDRLERLELDERLVQLLVAWRLGLRQELIGEAHAFERAPAYLGVRLGQAGRADGTISSQSSFRVTTVEKKRALPELCERRSARPSVQLLDASVLRERSFPSVRRGLEGGVESVCR